MAKTLQPRNMPVSRAFLTHADRIPDFIPQSMHYHRAHLHLLDWEMPLSQPKTSDKLTACMKIFYSLGVAVFDNGTAW